MSRFDVLRPFKTLEESIELYKKGVESDTDFEWSFDCEEVDLYEFDIDGSIEDQLDILYDGETAPRIHEAGTEVFHEFTQPICPAYKEDN